MSLLSRPQKAWTYTSDGFPTALHLITLSPSTTPLLPTEILVTTRAASLNPVDTQLMAFPLWPYIPSFLVPSHKGVAEDFSGVVLAVGGKECGVMREGDEVFGIIPFLPGGTLQEVVKIDVRKGVVLPKPVGWTWEEAASLPLVWVTAMTLVESVKGFMPSEGGKLVVLGGSSSCGMYVIHIAIQLGWTILSSCSSRNSSFVESMGASETVDYNTASVTSAVKNFAPDAIIDCVGGTDCLGLAKRYVTIVGDKTNRMAMGGSAIYLWNPQMVVRSLLGWIGLGKSYLCVNLKFERAFLEKALTLPKEKIAIDGVWGFEKVNEAFERMNTGRCRGKVVIRVSE